MIIRDDSLYSNCIVWCTIVRISLILVVQYGVLYLSSRFSSVPSSRVVVWFTRLSLRIWDDISPPASQHVVVKRPAGHRVWLRTPELLHGPAQHGERVKCENMLKSEINMCLILPVFRPSALLQYTDSTSPG